jgi:hypothetical protein
LKKIKEILTLIKFIFVNETNVFANDTRGNFAAVESGLCPGINPE